MKINAKRTRISYVLLENSSSSTSLSEITRCLATKCRRPMQKNQAIVKSPHKRIFWLRFISYSARERSRSKSSMCNATVYISRFHSGRRIMTPF